MGEAGGGACGARGAAMGLCAAEEAHGMLGRAWVGSGRAEVVRMAAAGRGER